MGADVNCNVGTRSQRFCDILVPHGLNNHNTKVRELLYIYKTNNLKILLSFFAHNNYITNRTFSLEKSAHMIDNFISYPAFFKRISDWKVTTLGVCSDHAAIRVKFRLTAIKFNNLQDDIEIIDWKKIQTEKKAKDEFNDRLFNELFTDAPYTEFNSSIILASQQTTTRRTT